MEYSDWVPGPSFAPSVLCRPCLPWKESVSAQNSEFLAVSVLSHRTHHWIPEDSHFWFLVLAEDPAPPAPSRDFVARQEPRWNAQGSKLIQTSILILISVVILSLSSSSPCLHPPEVYLTFP